MKIELSNPPKYVRCIKSFYGFNEGEVFKYDEESPKKDYISAYYRLHPYIRATASILHVELINALENGYFETHTVTEAEEFEDSFEVAIYQSGFESIEAERKSDIIREGFKMGGNWMRDKLKNK